MQGKMLHFVRCSPVSEMFKYGKGVLCVYMHMCVFYYEYRCMCTCMGMHVEVMYQPWLSLFNYQPLWTLRQGNSLACNPSWVRLQVLEGQVHWSMVFSQWSGQRPARALFLSCVRHYLCTHLSVHVCTCGGWMPMLGDFPSCSPYFLLRTGFSLKLELISLARLAGYCVPGIFLSQPPQC